MISLQGCNFQTGGLAYDMMERKCFDCGGFKYITYHCRNRKVKELTVMLSNRFEVLKSRVINIGE